MSGTSVMFGFFGFKLKLIATLGVSDWCIVVKCGTYELKNATLPISGFILVIDSILL
jgi:hypothetical protein